MDNTCKFEIYKLSCNNLREQLKSKVKAYVKVWVDVNDVLIVSFEKDGNTFIASFDDFLYSMITGYLTVDDYVGQVLTKYKNWVVNRYFV